MIIDKGIYIKNIYYMLTYAFKVLKQTNYEQVAAEDFDKIDNLFAAILARGAAQQVKQGLHREYVEINKDLATLRGRVDMEGSIRNRLARKPRLSCQYDELSVDNKFNQILKSTMLYLIRSDEVDDKHKLSLKRVVVFFSDVSSIELSSINWSQLSYQRNNQSYIMLMNICYLVAEGLLQTTDKGDYRLMGFTQKHLHSLFEAFLLEYYKEHHSCLTDIRAAQISWNLDDEDTPLIRFLPIMQSDIMLRQDDRVLIMDAKYHGNVLASRAVGSEKLKSANLYQIYSYVKNYDKNRTGKVSGLLLYAKTGHEETLNFSQMIDGNRIGAKTLDLNKDFSLISAQLDGIVEEYLLI